MAALDQHHCRFHRPGAILHSTKRYEGELRDFYKEDEDAAELYEALVRDARELGLHRTDNAELASNTATHRAPVGLRAFRRLRPGATPIPWMGELLVDGSDAVDGQGTFWRGYFSDLRKKGEPDLEIDDVLMASLQSKSGAPPSRRVTFNVQDTHMTQAGDAVKRWCNASEDFTFRI